MNITIKALELEGFKGFTGKERFDFGPTNLILGDNFQGKTSIGDAISYILAGVTIEGKGNADDRLMNKEAREMRAAMWLDVDGTEHQIERQVVRVKTKTTSTILVDGSKGTQAKIEELLGDKKFLTAALIPDLFCQLEPKDARAQLMSVLPNPTDADIRAKLADTDAEKAAALEGCNVGDPDFFIENQTKFLKDDEKELLKHQGALEEVEENLKMGEAIPDKIEIDDEPIREIEETKKSIEAAVPPLVDVAALEKKKLDILTSQRGNGPKLQDVTDKVQERAKLLAEYQQLQNGLKFDEHKITCENCGHEMNLNADQEKENERISARMAEILPKGQALKAEIDQATAENEQRKHSYMEQCAADIAAIDKEIAEAKAENERRIQEFMERNQETITELGQRLATLKENRKLVEQHNMKVDVLHEQKRKAEERVASLRADVQKLTASVEATKKKIEAAKAYNMAKCELQVEKAKESLDRVDIVLFDVTKTTGEIKNVFRLAYDGKEYKTLSTSEKIRCGLEISKLMRELTGNQYPVFIDNGESITHFVKPETQLFMTKVVPGAQGLTIIEEADINE